MDMVVEAVVGPDAKQLYSPWPTEWPNGSISDVLYLPNSFNEGNLPPVLIEVQHMVDNDFILRIMSYAISVYRLHKKLPVVITFAISSLKYEVSKKTTRNKVQPFLLQYSCQPWARTCYFVDSNSLHSSLVEPLPSFIPLSEFLIDQCPSLLANPYRADPTIQSLYSIATRVFIDQTRNHEKPAEELSSVCQKMETMVAQAMATLREEIPDTTKWIQTKT